jgi:hypothetical protein
MEETKLSGGHLLLPNDADLAMSTSSSAEVDAIATRWRPHHAPPRVDWDETPQANGILTTMFVFFI